jgi:DNA-binding transcriptional LysR family regulator
MSRFGGRGDLAGCQEPHWHRSSGLSARKRRGGSKTVQDKIDWDDLRVFLQTARAGNLAGAARRLRVDYSTVSRRIVRLEAQLGCSIFERQPSGLRLNEAGERLLRHAEKVETAVVSLKEDLGGNDAAIAGPVRVATMEGIASLYLASRFARLQEKLPAITVELVTSAQTVYVNRREADLSLSFFKPQGHSLVSERIGRFRLRLYGSRAYLERRGQPSHVAELGDHDYVTYIADLIQVDCVRWLDDVIATPRVAFRSSSMIAQMSAAASGVGLVLLPEFAVVGRDDLLPVLADTVFTTRELWLNVHNDLQFAPRIRAVANYLKQTVQGDNSMQAPSRPRTPLAPPDTVPDSGKASAWQGIARGEQSQASTVTLV